MPIDRVSANTALIFDLDGTLIHSAPDIHAACNRTLLQYGFAPLTLQTVQDFVGKGAPHLVARLLENAGENPDGPLHAQLLATLLIDYHTAVTLTHPYPGVIAALSTLHAMGTPLGLCTNKPMAPTLAVLNHLNLTRFFPVIIAGDSLPQKKPDPAPLHAAITALGCPRALFIGDSEVDAETAFNAAQPFLLYTQGYRKTPVAQIPHTRAFDEFAQLPALVQALA